MVTGPIFEQATKAGPFTDQERTSGRVCIYTSMAPVVPGVIPLSPEPCTKPGYRKWEDGIQSGGS